MGLDIQEKILQVIKSISKEALLPMSMRFNFQRMMFCNPFANFQ